MKTITIRTIITCIILQLIIWIGGGILIWKLLPTEVPQSICKLAIISLLLTPFSNGVMNCFQEMWKQDTSLKDVKNIGAYASSKVYGQNN